MRAQRLSKGELNELATSVVRRQVYVTYDEQSFRLSFGHLFMLMDEDLSPSQIESIGGMYEDVSKALPREINGYPMFFSGKLLHRDDVQPLHERIVRKQRALDGMPLLRRAMLRVMGR